MTLHVTDHAVLRMLQRAGGLDVEALRKAMAASLQRAYEAARAVGAKEYRVRVDGLIYCVSNDHVVTVIRADPRDGG